MTDEVWYAGLAASGLALLVTAALAFKAWRFTKGAARATGRVARVEHEQSETMSYGADHPAETLHSYRPHVAFVDSTGAEVQFASRVAHPRSPMFAVGDQVTVVYDPANAAGTAEILGPAVWRAPIFAGIGATVVVLATLVGRACG